MPSNHPVDLKFGIFSCLNKIEALLKFHQNCLTTSLIIHDNMIIIYIQVISFHRFLKNAQNRTSDVSTLSLREKQFVYMFDNESIRLSYNREIRTIP